MAATGTPTPNIGLRRPQGTDPASVDDINYNSALIDTKLGAVGNSSVQDQIDTLNSKLTLTDVSSLITNVHEKVSGLKAYSDGKSVVISFGLNSGITSGTKVFDIANSILPSNNNYIVPIYNGNGTIDNIGTVWIESSDRTKATYYGSSALGAFRYCSLVYLY